MPKIIVDRSQEVDLTPPAPGVYNVKVDTSESEVKQGAKAWYFTAKLIIEGGEEDGKPVNGNFMTTGRGTFRTTELLEAVGMDPGDSNEIQIDTDELHGRRCRAELGPQEDNPQFPEIKNIMPLEDVKDDEGEGVDF